MKLVIDGTAYAVTAQPSIGERTVRVPLAEAPPSAGTSLTLTADDGMRLQGWTSKDWLRAYLDGTTLVLTNTVNIIQSTADSNGCYKMQSFTGSAIPEGYYIISETCDTSAVQSYLGFVTLTVTSGIVTEIKENESAYKAWISAHPPEKTDIEKLSEKLAYMQASQLAIQAYIAQKEGSST